MNRIRVWDLPLRLFHWALVILIVFAVISAKIGGEKMDWHARIGYAILALLLFRLVWGLAGPVYARLSALFYSPDETMAYFKGLKHVDPRRNMGHNPLGSLSVIAMLLLLLSQVVSGLFSNDEIAFDGPLVRFISRELSEKFTWYHADIGQYALYVLVALHLVAIAYYRIVRKKKLIEAMISGDMESDSGAPSADDSQRMRKRGLVIFVVIAALVFVFAKLV